MKYIVVHICIFIICAIYIFNLTKKNHLIIMAINNFFMSCLVSLCLPFYHVSTGQMSLFPGEMIN